jgi:hypothetical protein
MMRSLEERLQNAQAEYPTLKAACEAQVERWRWSSWDRIEETPYEFKRHGFAKGSWLENPPENRGDGICQYGFDSEGRVIVARKPNEEFIQYEGNIVDATLYEYGRREPINVTRRTFDGARLIQFERCTRHGLQREIYHYEAGKLARVESWNTQDGAFSLWATDLFTYDSSGRLDRIERAGANGGQSRLYRRPRKGETMKAVAATIQRRFVEIIPQVIAASGIEEQVYCLALTYDLGNDPLPMVLALGSTKEREKWVAQYGADRDETPSILWAGGDFSLYNIPELELQSYLDVDLIDTYALFNQQYHLMATPEELAGDVINSIAAELMQMDWHDKLNITDDFVVYGVDFEANHLDRNMAASIPEARLALLRQRGFL